MADRRVLVAGGGVSGLAAAHRLSKSGVPVVLAEESSRLGGCVLTEREDGFLVDMGPDSFVSAKGAVVSLADELGISDRVVSTRPENRGTSVYWEGRLHPLPEGLMLMAPSKLRPVFGSTLLSSRGKLRMTADLVIPRRRGDGDESLASFVRRRLGDEALDRIAEPLVAGIHAAEPETMSLDAAFPRLPLMEKEHRSLILAARRTTPTAGAGAGTSYFASFLTGMGDLVDALAGALGDCDVRLGTGVSRIEPALGGYRVTLTDGSEVLVSGVVLAVPARAASNLLAPVSAPASEAVATIGQVSTAVVTLVYRSSEIPPLGGYGFVVPSAQRRRILGATYTTQKWEGRSDDTGLTMVRGYVGGVHGQGLAVASEDELVSAVSKELGEIVDIDATPVATWAHTWPGGLHTYTLGHLDRVATAEANLPQDLVLAGAAFHGIGLNECITSGRRAADRMIATTASGPGVRR